jgi:hypothetical protein
MLVAPMLATRAVLHVGASVAMVAAPAQLGIERVKCFDVEPAKGKLAEQRSDVLANLGLVASLRRRVDVKHLQPSRQQLIDRRTGPRVPPFVDLAK